VFVLVGAAVGVVAVSIGLTPRNLKPLGETATWGITVDPATAIAPQIAADAALVGRDPGIVTVYISMALQPQTQSRILDELRPLSSDHRVMITWEPTAGLADIASGDADDSMDRFLRQLDTFPGRVELRFAHEMNGDWYPWAGDPETFRRAWSRVHQRIAAVAPRVAMVWSVNDTDQPAQNALERYWPGDGQVDIIGIDGYNCLSGWRTPSQVFSDVYRRVSALDPALPIWITETASCEASESVRGSAGHSKAEWITELLDDVTLHRVTAIVWFDRNKEFDWRVSSSAAAAEAVKAGLSRPRQR
jgi:beta-mannanase